MVTMRLAMHREPPATFSPSQSETLSGLPQLSHAWGQADAGHASL